MSSGNTQTVNIRLSLTQRTSLHLEPWGREFDCPAGDVLQIVGHGPMSDCMEIEIGADGITVYGWPGSVVSVLRNGVEVLGDSPSPKT
jgi:hypothetical protein